MPQNQPLSAFQLASLFSHYLDLCDKRLEDRATTMASQAMSGGSSSSLNSLFGREGDAGSKAAQAFFSNKHLCVSDLRQPLIDLSWRQVEELGLSEVIVPFDPTHLGFQHQPTKQGRTELCGNGAGYTWLNSLLINPHDGGVLGVGHQTLVHEGGPDDAHEFDYAPEVTSAEVRHDEIFNPKQQQLTQFRAICETAPAGLVLDFTMDADFDDGLSVREMLKGQENRYFTLRSTRNRAVQVKPAEWLRSPSGRKKPGGDPWMTVECRAEPNGLVDIYLHDLVKQLPTTFWKELPVDARGRVCEEGKTPARLAKLEVGAVPVRLARRSERGKRLHLREEPVWANIVAVLERDAPAGVEPLCWVLMTSRPIETVEQQQKVALIYEKRWRAEEFFRTTKDGLKLERSRLETPEATARLLVFITLKAMFLDALRREAGVQAGKIPTKEERQELKRGGERLIELEQMTADQRRAIPKVSRRTASRMLLGYIAQKGGWKARGATHLGNYMLLRGLPSFFDAFQLGCFHWLPSIVKDPGS